ncbi:hypothetical protein CDL19_15640 [Mediterraneibacter gnavus]|nr:hypothetical protein CDL19_15640 [Mediterraneibacter gnavus]PLT66995.1 hypothetical protein CDL25_15415 [Mediterraneibacter gnavus]
MQGGIIMEYQIYKSYDTFLLYQEFLKIPGNTFKFRLPERMTLNSLSSSSVIVSIRFSYLVPLRSSFSIYPLKELSSPQSLHMTSSIAIFISPSTKQSHYILFQCIITVFTEFILLLYPL